MKKRKLVLTLGLLVFLAAPAARAQTTPPVPAKAADEVVKLDKFSVTADVLERYGARDTSSAAKTLVPLAKLPQAVQVVTSGLLEERRPVTLSDALYNVSGVADFGARRGFDNLLIRGFNSAFNVYLDGLRVERGNQNVQQELFGLDRVEVLKGPASVLFGQGALGGIVSQVSKRPQAASTQTLSVGVGAFEFYEAGLDVGGSIDAASSVKYRLNLLVRDQGDAIDFNDKRRFYVAPALTWELTPNTRLTLLANVTRDRHDAAYCGLPAVGTVLPNVNGALRRELYIGDPGLDGVAIDRIQLGYELEHRFNSNWKLTQNLRFTDSDVESIATFAGALQANQRTLNRSNARFAQTEKAWMIDTRVAGVFGMSDLKHNDLAGVDLTFQNVDQIIDFGAMPALDLFNPVYGAAVPARTRFLNFERDDTLVGLYVQDHMELGRFGLLVGGRWDSNVTDENNRNTSRLTSQTDKKLTGRVGLIYEFTPGFSAYASFAQSYNPNFGADATGARFKPETGAQHEAGLKSDAFGGRLRSTLAVYELTRQNAIISNLSTPGFSVAIGEQRSRGVEFDIGARLTRAWGLTAATSYTDVKITRDVPAQLGNRPVSVPKNQTSLWSTYEFSRGDKRTLTAGLGGRYVGRREGTLPNTYRLPSYVSLDAALIYRSDRLSAQINLYNLLDEDIYTSASPTGQRSVMVGDPLNARASVTWRF